MAPLPDDPTKKQIREYLSHGLKRMEQVAAVNILLNMWVEAKENQNRPNNHPLKGILGKTIKGVIVKRNTTQNYPVMSIHLIFSDDTSYEIYSDLKLNFTGGLDKGNMNIVRAYNTPPKGPMENIIDLSVDEEI